VETTFDLKYLEEEPRISRWEIGPRQFAYLDQTVYGQRHCCRQDSTSMSFNFMELKRCKVMTPTLLGHLEVGIAHLDMPPLEF
jgi:hypothetical protein